MKYLINDEGRECTCCGEFKQWDEYGNHKKGARGKKSLCLKCNAEDSYIRKHGCLKEDNIDPKHYDADKIMAKYRKKAYAVRLSELKDVFGRKNTRYCQLCNILKPVDKYSIYEKRSKHSNGRAKVCNDCKIIKDNMNRCPIHDVELRSHKDQYTTRKVCGVCEYEKKKKKKEERIQKAIDLASGNIDINNGFIYLYRCEELDCFKIGKTKQNPFDYINPKSKDYGLNLKMVAYVVSPVRDYDAEWLATKDIKHKRVKHTKPCGGEAYELFRCGLYEALLILRGISDKMYIEPNPFVTLEDLNAVEIVEHIPTKEERYYKSRDFSGVIARRMLREVRGNKQWNVDCGEYISPCKCRSIKFSRGVHIGKDGGSYLKFRNKKIYLGRHGLDKDIVIKKFKSVYDLKDDLFVNGRYSDGAEQAIKDEIDRVKCVKC